MDDGLVGVLNVDSLVRLNDRKEFSILIDGNGSFSGLDNACSNASRVIILTKARGAVDDSGTAICGNPGGTENCKATIVSASFVEPKKRLIAFANKNLALEFLKDGVFGNLALF